MKKVVVSFAIPEPIKRGMVKHCKKTGESRSALATRAIWQEIGDWRQDDLQNKDCHTFQVFCDSSVIRAVLSGCKKEGLEPESYIRHCILRHSYGV